MHFSSKHHVIEFTIDDDEFRSLPAIPAGVILDAQSQVSGDSSNAAMAQVLRDLMRDILDAPSYQKLETRTKKGARNPIDTSTLLEVMQWLIVEVVKDAGGKDTSGKSAFLPNG